MFVAHHQPAAFEADEAPDPARARPPANAVAGFVPAPSRYSGGSHRSAIWLIAAAHIAAIVALVKLDVLNVAPKRADLVLIELTPLAEAPPAKPQPKEARAPEVETPIVSPPPIVATPTPPPPVASVSAAPPVAVPRPVAAPVPAPEVAAPIVPPEGSAANLGNPSPRYPIESRRAREEGTVRLKVLISADGSVEDISVARSSGFDRLDRAALDAVRRWRFRAGTQAGKAVEAVGFLSIPFVLSR